jgi:hypothetical protein
LRRFAAKAITLSLEQGATGPHRATARHLTGTLLTVDAGSTA